MATIDFYWDIGSTNTYFAFHLIHPLAVFWGKDRMEFIDDELARLRRN